MMASAQENTARICDVLVIGSGSAALSAALRAARGGLTVLVIEKTAWLGGTSAMSGAGIWVPDNHIARESGIADSQEDALTYLRAASPEGWQETEDGLWQSFIHNAPRMLRFLSENTPIRFQLVDEPDPMAEKPGGKMIGRMVSPMPLPRRLAGRYGRRIRRSTLPHSFTYQEIKRLDPYHHPLRAGLKFFPKLLWRKATGRAGQGSALMIGLVRSCMDAGVEFLLETRAMTLIQDSDLVVTGATAECRGVALSIVARCGVVLATGGFEWNKSMQEKHFPGLIDRIGSPRSNEGDGQIMAREIGAKLERMDQANIYPSLPTRYEGQPHGMPILFQAEPHAIVVNRHGKRFVSENDFNIGEALDQRDPVTGKPLHLPAFLMGDCRFLKRSRPFRWYAAHEPGWVITAQTVAELAIKLRIPTEALQETVDRFNLFCDAGRDADFHRGESRWESCKAQDPGEKLGRIDRAPFVAMRMNRSILGTKGGARTNAHGQVLRDDGSVINGLYAAGLAMANPIGTRAVGAGTTIGPNLTWGFICAETMLTQNCR